MRSFSRSPVIALALSHLITLAQASHNETNIDTVGWESGSDSSRSTISLLYSCLFTIFLCTWSALHMNIPADDDSKLRILLRKCKWMAIALLAPECIAMLAMGEWLDVRKIIRKSRVSKPVSKVQGFFDVMGGYSIRMTTEKDGTASSTLVRLKPGGFTILAKVRPLEVPPEQEILDKNKGDWISKSITVSQILWFIAQLVGRAVERLSVTTLELFTAGIIVCTAATYFAWWKKPLDVQRPIVLEGEFSEELLREHGVQWMTEYQSLFDAGSDLDYGNDRNLSLVSGLIAMAFAACHLIGWGFYFPTRIEQILWRLSSVLCGVTPIVLGVIAWFRNEAELARFWYIVGRQIVVSLIGLYFIVRAYLLVEVFVSLRSVPIDVYRNVNWSAYLPHI